MEILLMAHLIFGRLPVRLDKIICNVFILRLDMGHNLLA